MKKNKYWSYSEEKLLIEKYETSTIQELMELFPGRSQESINNKIKRLKAKKKISGSKEKDAVDRAYKQR